MPLAGFSGRFGVECCRRDAGEPPARLRPWMRAWSGWVSAVFLGAYVEQLAPTGLLPEPAEVRLLLDVFLMEKALYELRYELNNRPGWVSVPLEGVLDLIEPS
jgi:maltose alpha-D-glucosyltransferase/alpha-amylase